MKKISIKERLRKALVVFLTVAMVTTQTPVSYAIENDAFAPQEDAIAESDQDTATASEAVASEETIAPEEEAEPDEVQTGKLTLDLHDAKFVYAEFDTGEPKELFDLNEEDATLEVLLDADLQFALEPIDDEHEIANVQAFVGEDEEGTTLTPDDRRVYVLTVDQLREGVRLLVEAEVLPAEEPDTAADGQEPEGPDATDETAATDEGQQVPQAEPVAANQPGEAQVTLSFVHAYLSYQDQVVAAPATSVKVPAGKDLTFVAHADEGYGDLQVSAEYAGRKIEVASEGDTYTIAGSNVTSDLVVAVIASAQADDKTETEAPTTTSLTKDIEVVDGKTRKIERPAVTLSATAEDGTVVTVKAPEGALPEGTTLQVHVINDVTAATLATAKAEDEGIDVGFITTYDVTLINAKGREIEPSGEVEVTFASSVSAKEELTIMHVADDANEAEVVSSAQGVGEQTFTVDSFSTYVMVSSARKAAAAAVGTGTAIDGSIADVSFYVFKSAEDRKNDIDGNLALGAGDTVTTEQELYGKLHFDYKVGQGPSANNLVFYYQIPKNLNVKDKGETALYDGSGERAGTWRIENNRIVITYDAAWAETHPNGGGYFNFDFKLDEDAVKRGEDVVFRFPGASEDVTIHVKEGEVTGQKDATINADGTITYTVKFNAQDDFDNFQFKDYLGGDLEFDLNSFKIDGTSVAVSSSTGAESGKENIVTSNPMHIGKGEHTLTYNVRPNQAALDALGSGNLARTNNQIDWTWGTSGKGTSSKWVAYGKNLVSKYATGNGIGNPKLDWVVTLNSGIARVNMKGYQYTDTLKLGHTYTGEAKVYDENNNEVATINLDSNASSFSYTFTQDSTQKYTIKYSTIVTNAEEAQAVQNEGTVTPPDGTPTTVTGTGSYFPGGSGDTGTGDNPTKSGFKLTKTVDTSQKDATGTVDWTITVLPDDTFPTNKDLTVQDTFGSWVWETNKGQWLYTWHIGEPVITSGATTFVKDVDYTISYADYNADFNGDMHPMELNIKFNKDAANVKYAFENNIPIVIQTKSYDDGTVGTRKNLAQYYAPDGPNGGVTAEYTNTSDTGIAKDVHGGIVYDQDLKQWVITWEIRVNVDSAGSEPSQYDLKSNSLRVLDMLPEGLTYVPNSVYAEVIRPSQTKNSQPININGSQVPYLEFNSDDATKGFALQPTVSVSDDNTLRLDLDLSKQFSIGWTDTSIAIFNKDTNQWWCNAKLLFRFKTTVDPSMVHHDGTDAEFYNTSKAYAGNTEIGTGRFVARFSDKVVEKSGAQEGENSIISYTVKINPKGEKLSTDDSVNTLTLKDTLDSRTSLVLKSLKVQNASGQDVTSTSGLTISNNETDANGNPTSAFTITVPDEQAFTVTYNVLVANAAQQTFQVSNTAELMGVSRSEIQDKTSYAVYDASGSVWGGAGAITITKSDVDDVLGQKLAGAEFTLYKIDMSKWDESRSFDEVRDAISELVQTGTTDANGQVVLGVNKSNQSIMQKDVLYYFKETAAPKGYVIDDKAPHFVMIAGDHYAEELAKAQARGINPSQNQTYIFTDTAEASTTIVAHKVVDHGTLAAGDYTFVLKEGDTEIATATNDAQGNVEFSTPVYTAEGSHTYTISEQQGDRGGISYDKNSYTVQVDVTRRAGKFKATVTYPDGVQPTFTNTYSATGSTTLNLTKKLDNRNFKSGDTWTFALAATDGAPERNNKSVTIEPTEGDSYDFTLGPLSFELADLDGQGQKTFTYQVTESGTVAGVTNAGQQTVSIKVSDAGDGTLTVTPQYASGNRLTFTNTYDAKGSAKITAKKQLNNADLHNEQFTFVLKDASGKEISRAKNDVSGTVTFDEIDYDLSDVNKTFYYTIEEVNDHQDNIEYAQGSKAVSVHVLDTGNGSLQTVVTGDGEVATFVNTFDASADVTLVATKRMDGRALTKDDVYQFVVTDDDGNVVTTGTSNQAGTVTFDPIHYNLNSLDGAKETTFNYTMREVAKNGNGVTCDTTEWPVHVTVTNNGTNTLETSVSYGTEGKDLKPVFTNTYAATGKVNFTARKTYNKTLTDGLFSVVLEAPNGSKQTASFNADGEASFNDVEITKAGTYIYKLYEALPEGVSKDSKTLAGVTYDTHVTEIEVKATDNGQGGLTITKSTGEGEGVDATFQNSYQASGEVVLTATKTLVGRGFQPLKAGEFEFELRQGDTVLDTKTNDAQGVVTFDAIPLTAKGTTTYTIVEKTNSASGGIVYDGNLVRTATVEVEDDGQGKLTPTVTYGQGSNAFTNSYQATGSISLVGVKELEGRSLVKGEFAFEVKDEGGEPVATGTNDENGNITFSKIDYTSDMLGGKKEKTFTYTVTEVEGAADKGLTYDTTTKTIGVRVVDDGQGHLQATQVDPNTKKEATADDLTFHNTYAASGKVRIKATKRLENRTLTYGAFTFELYDQNNNKVAEGTNAADGTITFPEISYAKDGTYTYYIVERNDGRPGYTYDEDRETVKVKVTDDGVGHLETEVSRQPSEIVFENTYQAKGTSVQLEAHKQLRGIRGLQEGEFEFELRNEAGDLLQTKENDGKGLVKFDSLSYSLKDLGGASQKEFVYTIREVAPEGGQKDGVTYDTNQRVVRVLVKDNGDGTMSANATYDQGNDTFVNTYTATEATAEIKVSKNLVGRDFVEGDEFPFTLTPQDGAPMPNDQESVTVTAHNAAAVGFGQITYQAEGTYLYTITEAEGSSRAITYDTSEHTVTVKVKDNKAGKLVATVTYDKGTDAQQITNTYEAAPVSVTLEARKAIANDAVAVRPNQFNFQLSSGAEPLQTRSNNDEGLVTFDAIEYTKPGTYTYTITEVNDEQAGYGYSDSVVDVEVTVTDDAQGQLHAAVSYNGQAAVPTFTNTYQAQGKATIKASKLLQGRAWKDADAFQFQLAAAEGTPLPSNTTSVATADHKTASFDEIEYQVSDLAGGSYNKDGKLTKTFTYTVSELPGRLAGLVYDETEHQVTVTVTDNQDGTLSTSVAYKNEGDKSVSFTNTYHADDTSVRLVAHKILSANKLSGKTLEEGDFLFNLTDEDGEVIQTAINDADGLVEFDSLNYRFEDLANDDGVVEPQTFVYTISEVNSRKDEVTYDDSVYTATVTVRDDTEGKLVAEVTYTDASNDTVDEATFRNVYFKANEQLSFAKHYYGADKTAAFHFTLRAADEAWNARAHEGDVDVLGVDSAIVDEGQYFEVTVSNDVFQDGVAQVSLPEITYYQAGTYRYLLSEDEGQDAAVYRITVEVPTAAQQANGAQVEASYEVAYGDEVQPASNMAFYNNEGVTFGFMARALAAMNATDEGASVVPTVGKVLEDGTLTEGQFSFVLRDANGTQRQVATNDETGRVAFDRIRYDEPGTYEYTISEVEGNDPIIIYDDQVFGYTVTVTQDADGSLQVQQAYTDSEGNMVDDPTFVNSVLKVVVRAQKRSREAPYDPLEGSTYGIWMANPGGEDVYMGNDVSDKNGYLYYEVPVTAGYAYYLLEEDAPHGHLVDPYPTDYFTTTTGDDGYRLVYENEPEFYELVPELKGLI